VKRLQDYKLNFGKFTPQQVQFQDQGMSVPISILWALRRSNEGWFSEPILGGFAFISPIPLALASRECPGSGSLPLLSAPETNVDKYAVFMLGMNRN
jgi:hypothetical protein